MHLLAPGFAGEEGQAELTATLVRIMLPCVLFASLAQLLGGMLNGLGKFAAASAMPVVFNLAVLAVLLGFATRLSAPTHVLAWGIAAAGAAQLGFVGVCCQRAGMLPGPVRPTRRVRRLLRRSAPAVVGVGASQAVLLVDLALATLLAAGSVSYVHYAGRVARLLPSVAGAAAATVLLPYLARRGAREGAAKTGATNRTLEAVLLLGVPGAVALAVIAEPVVAGLLQRGAFGAHAVVGAAATLTAYAGAVPAWMLLSSLGAVCFAHGDTATPMVAALGAALVNLVLSLALMGPLGHVGIALATSAERIAGTLGKRLRNWESGLRAFAERPLLGWGTGNYFVGSARHISARKEGNQVSDHAHNMAIEEAATKGVAGLAAYLLLWGVTGAVVVRRVRGACPREQALAVFAGAALAGWFVQSQTLFYSPSTWLQHMLLLGFTMHLEAASGGAGRAQASARWRTALAALEKRAGRAALLARAAMAALALALAGTSLAASQGALAGAAAIYRAEHGGVFLEDLERSMRAFEPLANGPRAILFNNVTANWPVLAAHRKEMAERLLGWTQEEAAAALAAEPQSWVIHHALARLYREFATTEAGLAPRARAHFERSLELAPNLDPLELPRAGQR